jgi:hypothetical protein
MVTLDPSVDPNNSRLIDVCRVTDLGTRVSMALKLLILRDVARQRGQIHWVAVRSRRSAKVVAIEDAAQKAAPPPTHRPRD